MRRSKVFISRSTRLRCLRLSGSRRLALIFMHSVFISLRNFRGSCGIRFLRPLLRISTVAFISVRAASRNNTQSIGK